jgi:hypothetical protein
MRSRVRYSIIYSRETYKHITVIERKYHQLIQKTIEEQLTTTPEQKTRNRKPLEELPGPFGSTL